MSSTDHATLGDLVLEQPAAAALFERLGLDFCCGGRRTLEQACHQRGLDAATVGVLLGALGDEPAALTPDPHDVAGASITDLCDHIVARHHEPLRADLPTISDLLGTVVRVHGKGHPELHDLQRLFATTRGELEVHMELEEHSLFPACRTLDQDRDAAAFDPGLLALLEDDHDTAGEALCALRELTGGYDADRALCGTHRRLLQALHAFELDLHQHVHEENNVLHPRVRGRLATAA